MEEGFVCVTKEKGKLEFMLNLNPKRIDEHWALPLFTSVPAMMVGFNHMPAFHQIGKSLGTCLQANMFNCLVSSKTAKCFCVCQVQRTK